MYFNTKKFTKFQMADNEKTMPFKRPKTEEMLEFRKDIKRGNIEVVREKILKNPKYLVSNGDTPAILQVKAFPLH